MTAADIESTLAQLLGQIAAELLTNAELDGGVPAAEADQQRHDVEGQQWTFTEDADGHMEGHSKARWGEYRAQSGQVRLEGESREVTKGFTWVECFADRIRAEGLTK